MEETIPVDSSSGENITRTSKPPDEVAIHSLSTLRREGVAMPGIHEALR
jgi:hypothetical protein